MTKKNIFNRKKEPPPKHRRNVLLTNGRFPVTIDLARQINAAGHRVFVVDPMHYHVCKFSRAVVKSYHSPAPHVDAEGYIKTVVQVVKEQNIDLIIPLHEEIFYLAECNAPEIKDKLFAPPFETLIRLHNKWEFSRMLAAIGLETPEAALCKSMEDVRKLDLSKEWALKPVFGRASANVYHLKPGKELEEVEINDEVHYIAQEWHYGNRYCSYSVCRQGKLQALSIYPVTETIDGSSCVFFEAIEHEGIKKYHEKLAAALHEVSGQIALDFIEDEKTGRLLAIECNPRATAGIHLYSGTTLLAHVLCGDTDDHPALTSPKAGAKRQVAPGMLMWEKKGAGPKQYLTHMKRLMGSRDVIFTTKDIMPSLMQPFLLTSYYEICRERRMKLPEMFQWDVTWEPTGEQLQRVRERLERENRRKIEPPADVVQNGVRVAQKRISTGEDVEYASSRDSGLGQSNDESPIAGAKS